MITPSSTAAPPPAGNAESHGPQAAARQSAPPQQQLQQQSDGKDEPDLMGAVEYGAFRAGAVTERAVFRVARAKQADSVKHLGQPDSRALFRDAFPDTALAQCADTAWLRRSIELVEATLRRQAVFGSVSHCPLGSCTQTVASYCRWCD